jgi:DNA-binding transcriptional LysR family regulator
VTRLIQDLEADLGFELLHRKGPRITPTERGVLFHGEVERLLSGLKHIRERAVTIARSEPQPIEIAAIPALAGLVSLALARLPAGAVPRQIHLQTSSAEQVVQSVLARTADIGIASLPIDHPGLDVHWIAEAPCVAAVAASDPLAARDVVSMADLADRRLIVAANPYRLRRRVDEAIRRACVSVAGILDTNASFAALCAARAGLGIAVIEPVTAVGMPMSGLAIRPLDVPIRFFWGVVTPVARPVPPTIEALIGTLQGIAAELLQGFRLHDPADRESLMEAVYGSAAPAHPVPSDQKGDSSS